MNPELCLAYMAVKDISCVLPALTSTGTIQSRFVQIYGVYKVKQTGLFSAISCADHIWQLIRPIHFLGLISFEISGHSRAMTREKADYTGRLDTQH